MIDRALRSVLFLPASNPRAVEKARTLDCDAVVLDLEDATGREHTDYARAAAVQAVKDGGFGERILAVRVNALDTVWGAEDLEALGDAMPDVVLLPKVGSAQDIRDYAARLPEPHTLWAMIETCRGVAHVQEIASAGGGLCGLVLGTNDLSADMRRPLGPDRRALHYAMGAVVTAARACGLAAIDGVFNGLDDTAALAAEAAEGRAFGFDGKSLIHPSQIAPANRAFAPTDRELQWARAVVDAYANSNGGAVRVGGDMIERLHVDQAERMLRIGAG